MLVRLELREDLAELLPAMFVHALDAKPVNLCRRERQLVTLFLVAKMERRLHVDADGLPERTGQLRIDEPVDAGADGARTELVGGNQPINGRAYEIAFVVFEEPRRYRLARGFACTAPREQQGRRNEGGAHQEGTARRRSTVLRRAKFTIHVIALVHALDVVHSRRRGRLWVPCGEGRVNHASQRFDKSRTAPPHSHGICTFRVADWMRRADA